MRWYIEFLFALNLTVITTVIVVCGALLTYAAWKNAKDTDEK